MKKCEKRGRVNIEAIITFSLTNHLKGDITITCHSIKSFRRFFKCKWKYVNWRRLALQLKRAIYFNNTSFANNTVCHVSIKNLWRRQVSRLCVNWSRTIIETALNWWYILNKQGAILTLCMHEISQSLTHQGERRANLKSGIGFLVIPKFAL
jgi:hypothetical protein